jgi:hypothetical protein
LAKMPRDSSVSSDRTATSRSPFDPLRDLGTGFRDSLVPNQIVVRAGKGDKDRYTMLPAAVKELLIEHLDAGKRQHQNDLAKNLG